MSVEDAGDLLRRHRLRSTPQRRAILGAFRYTREEHLSAEEVLSRAAMTVPELGRGTVYATLAELAEVGVLASVGSAEPVRYETNLAAHDHFHCRLCRRLFDVDLCGETLTRGDREGFTIESVAVRAEGICAECHEYGAGLDEGAALVTTRPTLSPVALAELTCLRVASPVGMLGLVASGDGVVRIAFEDHADFAEIVARARSRRGSTGGRTRCRDLHATFDRYFEGDRRAPVDLVDWRLPGETNAGVLGAVQRIPYAGSLSYERLGGELSARDCGRLMGANPLALLVPCHRVSRGSDRSGAYVGGAERLCALHTLEAG